MIRWCLTFFVFALLSGCANYIYDGKAYATKEEFFRAVDTSIADVLSTIEPLPTPLTSKGLIFALPALDVMVAQTFDTYASVHGSEPTGVQREMLENIVRANYKNNVVYFEAIKKRNIFSSVVFVDIESMSGALEASESNDVLYYVEPKVGSGQYFYISYEHGKQIFAADRSSPTAEGKVQAFVEAAQLLAIRD